MSIKRHKALSVNEVITIKSYMSGNDELTAYQEGHPNCKQFKPETIIARADKFFSAERIKHYLTKDINNLNDRADHLPGGAPSLYKHEYVQKCYDYFNIPAEELVQTEDKDGSVKTKLVANALPTKAGFACKLQIPSTTLRGWATQTDATGELKHPEFATAWSQARDAQQQILVHNTLKGKYNPAFAKFVAQNLLDWSEKQNISVNDESKPKITINVSMTAEEAAQVYLEEMKPREDK